MCPEENKITSKSCYQQENPKLTPVNLVSQIAANIFWSLRRAKHSSNIKIYNLITIIHLNSLQIPTSSVNKHEQSLNNEKINLIKRNTIWPHGKDLIKNGQTNYLMFHWCRVYLFWVWVDNWRQIKDFKECRLLP